MARKYSKKGYGFFKKGTKVIREHCAPDPMEKIKNTGATGKMIGDVGDSIIEKPIQKASYALTGVSYNKKKDHPCKGSATYTAWYIGIKGVLKIIFGILLGLPLLAVVVRFLNADFITQVKMTSGLLPIFFLIYAVSKIKDFFSKIFGKK